MIGRSRKKRTIRRMFRRAKYHLYKADVRPNDILLVEYPTKQMSPRNIMSSLNVLGELFPDNKSFCYPDNWSVIAMQEGQMASDLISHLRKKNIHVCCDHCEVECKWREN